MSRLKTVVKPLLVASIRHLQRYPLLSQSLDSLCIAIHRVNANFNYDHETNGERWLIDRLAQNDRLRLVFDVGANRGDWTALVLKAHPGARLHCFEISPPTFEKLKSRFATNPNVKANCLGLSDTIGEVDLNYSSDCDELSSMVEVVCPAKTQTIKAQVSTGLAYCEQHQIGNVDFLKIDVEGAEPRVLRGFGRLLTPPHIPVVQFEYGMSSIVSRFLLRDFYNLFTSLGYRVGKLYPERVDFREYRFQDEDFYGPNYVAASPEIASLLTRPGEA